MDAPARCAGVRAPPAPTLNSPACKSSFCLLPDPVDSLLLRPSHYQRTSAAEGSRLMTRRLPTPVQLLRTLAGYLAIVTLMAVWTATSVAADAKPDAAPAGTVSYFRDIRPIFQTNCQGCHQPAKAMGELVMTNFDGLHQRGRERRAGDRARQARREQPAGSDHAQGRQGGDAQGQGAAVRRPRSS